MTLTAGTKLGRYEIRSPLGKGGMGEVYLAHDTSELGRPVALKILPAEVAKDKDRLQRFTQEARTVSNLNHPNILTVYEFDQTESASFMATEFVDGVTLREHLFNSRLKLFDVLDITIQIVAALNGAHEAGVTHRDLKPENVMIRRDHIVKVLDFGLAKLSAGVPDTEAETRIQTEPGLVMGTTRYMSPEQSAGKYVDQRTDIWSVGVVLYEMIAGVVPFQGKDIHRQVIAIEESEPVPLSQQAEVPERLEEIVTKCLAKDKNERYQTAKDLLIDLRNLRRKLDFDAEIGRSVPPQFRSTSVGISRTSTQGRQMNAQATAAAQASTSSSVEYVVTEIKRHRVAAAVALLVLVAAIIGLGLYLRNKEGAIQSIAVLPFENQNHDANTEYMSDGLTDSIINSLTQLPNLRVIARSSVFRYKGKQTDPLIVARELGVRAVLTGRLMQRGDNVVVSTELIDAQDNHQIWGEQYERKLADLLTVQREIAQQIAGNLRLKLSGEDQGQMAKHYTDNPEAYQLYLKGRFYWEKRNEDGLKKSIDYFNQAIERDPNYSLAYSGLADAWFTIAWFRYQPPRDAYAKAKQAATKALEIDNKLAEAHTTLAMTKANYEWDWSGAENEFKLALAANPKYASAHHRYSLFLPILGRLDEAVAEAKKAQELDPLSLIINENLGDVLGLARRYDEAEAQLRKTLELDPSFEVARRTLARVYETRGKYEESLDISLVGATPEVAARVKHIYGTSGIKGVRQDRLERLIEASKTQYVSPNGIAMLYVLLGENDKAFAWLEKALEERSILFTYLIGDPRYDSFRSDPRFGELKRRVGLPQ